MVGWDTPEPIRSGRACKTYFVGSARRAENPPNSFVGSVNAYNILDNNYFKLRDLGQAFDFDVSWDEASQTITIDTSASYTPD